MLRSQALRVLEYINSLSYVPTLAEVGRAVGLSPSTVWRVLRELRELGVGVRAVVDLTRLGLVEVLLIYRARVPPDRVPRRLLRSYIRTLEGETFLKYVTKVHEVEATVNYVVDAVGAEPSEVYVVDAVVPPRYVLTHVARGALDRLYPRELLAAASQPQGRPGVLGRADPVDIALANRLEEDALVRVKDVYRELRGGPGRSPSYQTVLRHYREHLLGRGAIAGLRPTLENYVARLAASSMKLLVLYGTPASLSRGVRALVAIPAFTEAYLSSREGVAYTTGFLPVGLVPKVVEFLRILESRGLVGEWRILEVEPASVLRLPIPEVLGAVSVAEALAAGRGPGPSKGTA